MIIQIAIWVIVSLFLGGTLIWAALLGLGMLTTEPNRVYGADDVQVRILTIGDAEQTVRRTANKATDHFDDVHIVSEKSMPSPPNTTVHVVPDEFESDANAKGRAMDWASHHILCDREYVLYLDEDTIVAEFDGLPDEDIVQFLEQPMRTDSRLSWYIEVARIGFQQEMFGFRSLPYPLYLWGGGFAVRSAVESDVGWDVASVAEDTTFLWRAIGEGYGYTVTRQRFRNQAPPTISALIQQRKRWVSGTLDAIHLLPALWKALVFGRNIKWVASLFTIGVIVGGIVAVEIPFILAGVLFAGLATWPVCGAAIMRDDIGTLSAVWVVLVSIALFPLLHTLNAIGVADGLLRPADDFAVTEKT